MIDIDKLYNIKKTPLKNIQWFKSYERKFGFSFCGYVHNFRLKNPKMVLNATLSTNMKFSKYIACHRPFDRELFEKLSTKGTRSKKLSVEKIFLKN